MIRWNAPGPYVVAFTTRGGGVSEGPFASRNLGLLTADDEARVVENRRRACTALGADVARLAMNRQVNGAVVHRVAAGERRPPGVDLWTDRETLLMLKLTSDWLTIA